jgi:Holliday junction resolvase
MTNRDRGDYLERQTRAALAQYGWVVVRAGGSLGPADLVALRDGSAPLLVQCKILGAGRRYPRIDPHERLALWNTAEIAGARPVIATRYRGGWISVCALLSPHETAYPTIDELHVSTRPGKRGSPT